MSVWGFLKKLALNFSLPLSSWLAGFPLSLEGGISLEKIWVFLKKAPFFKSFFPSQEGFVPPDFAPPSHPQKSRESSILDFWRAVEYFSVQHIPEVTLEYAMPRPDRVFSYDPTKDDLPWDETHQIRQYLKKRGMHYTYPSGEPSSGALVDPSSKKEGKFLRFKVFGGVYSAQLIRQTLEDKCGKDDDYGDALGTSEKLKEGDVCAYFFNVTDDGRPLFDSFLLPTCGWALGRTINPGPHHPAWLSDFEEFEMRIKADFRKHFAIEDDDAIGQELKQFNVGRVITSECLTAYTRKMMDGLGLGDVVKEPETRFESFFLDAKPKKPGNGRYEVYDAEFLNSFFIDDLTKISKILDRKEGDAPQCGLGLEKFLADEEDIEIEKRLDIRHNRRQLLQSLAPSKFPAGCWPTKGDYPLATSQQFTVNEIRNLNHTSGILAVNGPPGTGKTMLLRDLISSVVVGRAKLLSILKKPSDAFEGEGSWKSTGEQSYERTISLWKPEFRGFEMVVGSSNNGAIENITKEIPGREAIDASWLPEIDYFRDLASTILGQPDSAWGLVGAWLGSKKTVMPSKVSFGMATSRVERNHSLPNTLPLTFFQAIMTKSSLLAKYSPHPSQQKG